MHSKKQDSSTIEALTLYKSKSNCLPQYEETSVKEDDTIFNELQINYRPSQVILEKGNYVVSGPEKEN
jgi:hypothetical protein